MKKRAFLFAIMCGMSILSSFAQNKYNEDKEFIEIELLVVDTAAVYNDLESRMITVKKLSDCLGKKTSDQSILDLAASVCESATVLDLFEKSQVNKSLSKGKVSSYLGKELRHRSQIILNAVQALDSNLPHKNAEIRLHDNGHTYIIETINEDDYYYGSSSTSHKTYDGYSMIVDKQWYPYLQVIGEDKDIPTKHIKYTIRNEYYRPLATSDCRDIMDVEQQRSGYEWIFNESNSYKNDSYPIEMEYSLFASHPELRISGNAIYDAQGKLKRIIQLCRAEGSFDRIKYDNITITNENGPYCVNAMWESIIKLLYANDYKNNKYGIKENLDADTKYAIENLVGIQSKTEQIDKMAVEYDAANFVNANNSIKQRMSQSQRAEFNALWAKVSKYPPLIESHRKKMNNDKARKWYQQVVSDHEANYLTCYRISRVNDLCFAIEYADSETHSVIIKAIVEFFNAPTKKNNLNYDWRIKQWEVNK